MGTRCPLKTSLALLSMALLTAGLLKGTDLVRATEIVEEEINVRKALGVY